MENLKILLCFLNIIFYLKSSLATSLNSDVELMNVQLSCTGTKAAISWDINGDESLINHYVTSWIGDGKTYYHICERHERRYEIDALKPNTLYKFCIQISLINGNKQTPICKNTTTYYADPSLMSVGVVPTEHTLNLSWDVQGPSNIIQYFNITHRTYNESLDVFDHVSGNIRQYKILDLLPNTKYKVCIQIWCHGDIRTDMICDDMVTKEENAGECPPTYIKIGEQCYHVDTTTSWIKGRSRCEELSVSYGYLGDLAVFDNFGADFNHISEYMIQNNITKFWIGAFDIGHEGNWKWVNASPLDLRSSSWQCNTPENDTAKNCAMIAKVEEKVVGTTLERIKLIDAPCDSEYTILCQLKTMFKRKTTF